MFPKDTLIRSIAGIIIQLELSHPTRVAVDGVDEAGKTVFADELKEYIEKQGRKVIRASIKGFHNPRRMRYERGKYDPEGYYLDSFNYRVLLDELLLPLGPRGSLNYRSAFFDYLRDKKMTNPSVKAPGDAVLLFDGVRSVALYLWMV